MTRMKKNRVITIFAAGVLAVCMFGGVVALGACGKNENENDVPDVDIDIGTGDDAVSSVEKTKVEKLENSYTPAAGTGKTYYVSPDVAQFTTSSCDGTYENPYNILDLVGYGSSGTHSNNSILEPGDTVLVMPGEYKQVTSVYVEKSGTYDNYITIMNAAYANDKHTYESTSCTISLYGESFDGNARGVTINSDYIYWYGIDVAGAGDNGMYIGGSHNVIENSQFYNNRDTGLQLGRKQSADTDIKDWPSYNLIKNCTSFNNYDNETYGENADGFGAKLTIGYGNMFDGCIAYRNSDDGWDLYAKEDTGNIGCVIIYNCIAFENGYLLDTQAECNARFPTFNGSYAETNTNSYTTRDGDGNGFKLGGGSNEGDVKLYNCMSFNNRMHGVTDNSNPGTLQIDGVTSYNNCASIDDDAPVASKTEENGEIEDETEGNENGDVEEITFGQVKYDGGTEDSGCANIDLARWAYSYNTLANVLSVIDGNNKTANDAYRGATTNCMFNNYYIQGTVDADSKNDGGIKGTAYSGVGDVFMETPALDLGIRTSFNKDGIVNGGEGNIHYELRENDGTINAGDMLKIKEDANLKVASVGADLSGMSWDDYTHYDYTVGSSSSSAEEDDLIAVYNMIYLPVDESAVFQNFKVVNSIWGLNITWTSSDSDVLRVTKDVVYTTSQSSTVGIVINRDPDEDKDVTLTAHFESDTLSCDKSYNLIIRKDIPSIGDVLVDGVEYGQAIVDQYSAFPEPAVTVENGSDYNGKKLEESLYTIETTYEYAPTAADTFDEIGVFTTSNAGVYRITLNISINNPEGGAAVTEKSYTYLIYVASKDAEVAFIGTPTLTVYKDGFEITGSLSSPTGYSYVLKTTKKLESEGGTEDVTASQIMESEEVKVEEFRETTWTRRFDEANDSGYYVYCVLTSLDGTQISPVYQLEAAVSHITTTNDFIGMMTSNNSHTVYLLDNDIDFTGVTYTAAGTFKGLFNGLGHTISNISTTNRAVFDRVDGGTIENIKFENISINFSGAGSSSGTSTSAGLIGYMTGGYIYNVAAADLSVVSNGQRVGGIVGDIGVSSGGNTLTVYIDLVSVKNTYTHAVNEETGGVTYSGAVISGDERVAGIVGFIQAGGTDSWNKVYISNCYVDAYITATAGIAAGIVGRSDDRNSQDYLEIDGCHIYGLIESTSTTKSYLGGVVGQFTGTGATRIYNCTSYGELWFGNESLTGSLKNASWIVGNFAANGDIVVSKCYALREEYNEEYGVSTSIVINNYSSWQRYNPHDMSVWTYVFNTDPEDRDTSDNGDGTWSGVKAPYLELVFQGEWDLDEDEAESGKNVNL